MRLFHPMFAGQLTIDRLPDDFTARLQRRVEEGLFSPGHRGRANYRVRSVDANAITFQAEGLPTTYNVGLNEVSVWRAGPDQIQYHVSYWGWTRIAVMHAAVIGIALTLCYLMMPALRREVSEFPLGPALFWGMVGFWSLAWPWILSAVHRGPAERALRRILRVTLSDSPSDQLTSTTRVA